MREQLEPLLGKRDRFTGTFSKFGAKSGWRGPLQTILLVDIKRDGRVVADHVWLTMYKRFSSVGMEAGDEISFDATVTQYEKGYKGYNEDTGERGWSSIDYTLSYPNHVRNETSPNRRIPETDIGAGTVSDVGIGTDSGASSQKTLDVRQPTLLSFIDSSLA